MKTGATSVSEIKLPVVGHTSKRSLMIGGVAAAAVVGFVWWRKRGSAPAAAAADVVDPGALDTPADPSAYQTADGSSGAGVSLSGTGQATSNALWEQQAIDLLQQYSDHSPGDLSAALGKYLTGSHVVQGSTDEKIIHEAIAINGYPPTSGPGGYPPAINEQPPTGQPKPPPKPKPKPKTPPGHPKPKPKTSHYTIRSGDTLTGIARAHHTTKTALYNHNRTTIEHAAHAHHHKSSNRGNLIFPGTVLVIP